MIRVARFRLRSKMRGGGYWEEEEKRNVGYMDRQRKHVV